jgi:hypothetical protein
MGRGFWILLTGLLWAARPASYQSPDIETIEALAARPEQFADPQVRLKIFRALEGPSADVVAAAVDIVMSSPELAADPQLWRRFNAALSNTAPDRRKAILDRAAKKGAVSDVRVIAVLVEGLTDPSADLRSAALALVKSQPALQKNPAVAEALVRTGEAVPAVVLPAFDVFKTRVQPVLETIGPDNKRCSNCHEAHSVLRLPPMEAAPAPDEVLQVRYRNALRVVDLEAPERSLILRKPTSPKGEAPFTHGGDVRFEPGSPPYQAILEWIKTGAIRR